MNETRFCETCRRSIVCTSLRVWVTARADPDRTRSTCRRRWNNGWSAALRRKLLSRRTRLMAWSIARAPSVLIRRLQCSAAKEIRTTPRTSRVAIPDETWRVPVESRPRGFGLPLSTLSGLDPSTLFGVTALLRWPRCLPGAGGMGEVYRAHNSRLDGQVSSTWQTTGTAFNAGRLRAPDRF